MPANFSPAKSAAMCSPLLMANRLALCRVIRGYFGNEMAAGAGGAHVGPVMGLCQVLMPVAQGFVPQPVPAPFPVRDDSQIVVPGRYEDQTPRSLTTGSVYPRTERGRRQLPDYTVAHCGPAKTRGR
jgi:hypothetical protein